MKAPHITDYIVINRPTNRGNERSLYVNKWSDDTLEIDGNLYLTRSEACDLLRFLTTHLRCDD